MYRIVTFFPVGMATILMTALDQSDLQGDDVSSNAHTDDVKVGATTEMTTEMRLLVASGMLLLFSVVCFSGGKFVAMNMDSTTERSIGASYWLFPLYLTIDLFQNALFLTVDIGSSSFVLLLLVQEVSSVLKNMGAKDWLIHMWKRARRQATSHPFRDPAWVQRRVDSGMADSASEIAAAIIVPALVAAEFLAKDWSPEPAEFKCILTCQDIDGMATWRIAIMYTAVLVVRLVFLTVERHLVITIVARIQLRDALRSSLVVGDGARRGSLIVAVMRSLVATGHRRISDVGESFGRIRSKGSFRQRFGSGNTNKSVGRSFNSFEARIKNDPRTRTGVTGVASSNQLGLAASAQRVFGRGGRLQASAFVSLGCIIIFQSICQLFRVKYLFF